MNAHCTTQFTATCPVKRAVTVRGVYSAIRVSDLIGGADIQTTHARITILNVGPRVVAKVEHGLIDYSGQQGSVELSAGWEINLNFTSRSFAGEMKATAEGSVKVLLPHGFTTSFAASTTKDAAFVCRADIAPHIQHREEVGRVIHTFGQGTPPVRLLSMKGPIVIDNQPAAS